jgi:hypothetical protein
VEQQKFEWVFIDGLVPAGRLLRKIDSTYLKANANKDKYKYDLAEVQGKPQDYHATLDAAVAEDRAARGKAP